MFFILSKVLFFLLIPFWWIIILLVWMLLSKSIVRRRRLRNIIIILLVLFTSPLLFQQATIAWQEPVQPTPPPGKYETAIVLGGMAGYDKNGRGFFGNNADRFIQTANLYHQGIVKKILISGGTGKLAQDEPSESIYLHEQFLHNGIPDSAIIIESESRNTYENAIFSKRILDSLHIGPPYVLVTSALHMTRSKQIFIKTGFAFVSFPCDYKVLSQKLGWEDFVPNIHLLHEWTFLIKEIVGLGAYKLTGKA